MGMIKLEGDFSPVEIRGYSLNSTKTCYEYGVVATGSKHKIIAIGKETYRYIDAVESTTMGDISIYSTFKRNVIAEYQETSEVIKLMFRDILTGIKCKIFKPTVAVCVPFELTGVEIKAFHEVFMMAGAKHTTILDCDFEENKIKLANKYPIVFGIIPNEL